MGFYLDVFLRACALSKRKIPKLEIQMLLLYGYGGAVVKLLLNVIGEEVTNK
jgi:hypothetical protein